MGRTHYVDDDTLSWHKSKVLSARATGDGLLFAITTSDALDMHNTKRGFRYVIFDLSGHVLGRPDLEHTFKRHEQATKAMWAELNAIDASAVTVQAIERAEKQHAREMGELRATVAKIGTKQAA